MEQNKFFVRHRMFSMAAFLVAAILIVFCLLDFNRVVKLNLLRDTRAQTEAIGANAVRLLENEMGHLKNLTKTAGALMSNGEQRDEEWILDELNRYATQSSLVCAVFVTLDGQIYTSHAGYMGPAATNTIGGVPRADVIEPIVVPPVYAKNLKRVIFGVAAPTMMGGQQGVLAAYYDVARFQELFESTVAGGNAQVGILERSGAVVLGQNYDHQPTSFGVNVFEEYVDSDVQFSIGSSQEMQNAFQMGNSGYAVYNHTGEARYMYYQPTRISDWYVVVMMPEAALRPQARTLQTNGILLTVRLTVVMACLMAAIFFIRYQEELNTHKILQEAAMMDGLTHIYNRGAVERLLTEQIEKAPPSSSHALFVMDVDAFKQINDTYGHLVGDDVLIAFAEHLRRIFWGKAVFGRMGGDEFIALLDNPGSRETVLRLAAEITAPFFLQSQREAPPVSVSVGISFYSQDGNTFRMLYQKADQALYDTKRQGKNGFSCYTEPTANTATATE